MSFKGVSLQTDGDFIEVKLSDSSHTPYYKRKVNVKDKRGMEDLKRELLAKGISLNPNGKIEWLQ